MISTEFELDKSSTITIAIISVKSHVKRRYNLRISLPSFLTKVLFQKFETAADQHQKNIPYNQKPPHPRNTLTKKSAPSKASTKSFTTPKTELYQQFLTKTMGFQFIICLISSYQHFIVYYKRCKFEVQFPIK